MIVVIERLLSSRSSWPVRAGFLGRLGRTQGARLATEVHVKTLVMPDAALHGHDHASYYLLNQLGK
jgi:hypothetical protein